MLDPGDGSGYVPPLAPMRRLQKALTRELTRIAEAQTDPTAKLAYERATTLVSKMSNYETLEDVFSPELIAELGVTSQN